MAKRKASLDKILVNTDYNCQRNTKRLRRALEAKYAGEGSDASYIFLSLILYISKNEWGYYIENDENLILDLADETAKPAERIKHTIEVAAELGLIDQKLYEKGIITSQNIQDDYFTIIEKLRRQIDINNLPYLLNNDELADSDSSTLSQHNTEEYIHNDNIMQKNVEDCCNPSALLPHNTEECMHNDNIMQNNAEECLHNDNIIHVKENIIEENKRGGENKSAPAHTRAGECTHPTPPPIFFENQKLQKLWENLLKQPLWAEKTPEALEIAAKTLAEYDSFIAMEMISHTIGAGLREIFPPKEEMFAVAKRKRDAYNKKHPAPPISPPADDESNFDFLSTPKSEKAKEMLNKWSEIINLLPVELKERAAATKFEFKDEGTCVTAPSEIHEFIESKILEKVKSILQSFDPKIKLFYT